MKTVEERAAEWLRDNKPVYDEVMFKSLVLLLKEQDKITRHACANDVIQSDISNFVEIGKRCKIKDMFHSIIINTKAI